MAAKHDGMTKHDGMEEHGGSGRAMMMMMMRRTAMTGTTTRKTLHVRTQSSPCMHALSAMPSAQPQRRSPKPAILWTNLHPRRQTSTCACSVQLSSVHSSVNISRRPDAHHSPRRSYTPFRLEEDVGDGGNSTAKALSPLQLAGAAVIIASKDIHTQGDHLVIYASSSTQRSGRHRHSPWTHCSSLPAHRATARTVAATTWRRLPPTTST